MIVSIGLSVKKLTVLDNDYLKTLFSTFLLSTRIKYSTHKFKNFHYFLITDSLENHYLKSYFFVNNDYQIGTELNIIFVNKLNRLYICKLNRHKFPHTKK